MQAVAFLPACIDRKADRPGRLQIPELFSILLPTKTNHMKKIIIGALVGGLLIFIWQTVSWTVLNLHQPAQQYTAKQDTILNFLSGTLPAEGGYLVPTVPPNTSFDEANKMGEKMVGKPWAFVEYHKSFDMSMNAMYMNMLKGYLSTVLMVAFVCWILIRWGQKTFGSIFLACLLVGLVVFINQPFTTYIWYKIFDIKAHLIDSLMSWGLCGVWLGWWLRRK